MRKSEKCCGGISKILHSLIWRSIAFAVRPPTPDGNIWIASSRSDYPVPFWPNAWSNFCDGGRFRNLLIRRLAAILFWIFHIFKWNSGNNTFLYGSNESNVLMLLTNEVLDPHGESAVAKTGVNHKSLMVDPIRTLERQHAGFLFKALLHAVDSLYHI
jgi:hypothetical protein